MKLLDFDGRANSLELLGDLFGFFLADAFLDGLGSGLNDVLGFLQAQAGNDFTDDLDDLDLFGATRSFLLQRRQQHHRQRGHRQRR